MISWEKTRSSLWPMATVLSSATCVVDVPKTTTAAKEKKENG